MGCVTKMNFRRGERRAGPEINLIAFIDVLLVILIFLMASTTFTRFNALRVSLPSASIQPPPAAPATMVVEIDSEGRYAIDHQRLTERDVAAISAALQSAARGNPEVVIEIHADALATHQAVVVVMDAARQAGLPKLSFSTLAAGRR